MLAIVRHPSGALYHLDFGAPVDPKRSFEEHVRWVLADYRARRDCLWERPPVEQQAVLVAMLDEVRAAAPRLLQVLDAMRFLAIPTPGADEVMTYLQHPSPPVRRAAIDTLGSMGSYPAQPHLERLLQSADSEERLAAARALAKLGKDTGIAAIKAAATRDVALEPYVVKAEERKNVLSLGSLNALAVTLLVTEDYEDICPYGTFCGQQLARELGDRKVGEQERWRATRVLGLTRQRKRGGPTVREVFEAEDTAEALRLEAVTALGRMGEHRALPAMLQMLPTATGDMELALVESVGRMRRASAFGVLLNHYNERQDLRVREAVRAALARISLPLAHHDELWGDITERQSWVYVVTDDHELISDNPADPLENQLVAESPLARRDACFALSLCGDPVAHAAQVGGVARLDTNPDVKKVANAAVWRLQARGRAKQRRQGSAPS